MAQGKEYTQQERDEVIELLKPHLQRGCSITRACDYVGFPRTTVQTWAENDSILRLKITNWQNQISATARDNIAKRVIAGDVEVSMKWLEKKEKDEWSNRSELAGVGNEPLFPSVAKVAEFESKWFKQSDEVKEEEQPENITASDDFKITEQTNQTNLEDKQEDNSVKAV